MAAFATLLDVKRHLNMTSTTHDDELQLMVDAATDVVVGLIGQDFTASVVSERVVARGGTVILSRRPIVGDVVLNGGAVTGFSLNRSAGLLIDVPYVYGPLVATYTVGDGLVPAAVSLATMVIASHLWESQRGTSPTALQAADTNEFVPGLGFTVPNRAKELLEPYMASKQLIA